MPATHGELSERESEILRLLATGASNKEIAQQLSISTNTVKVHLRNIFEKIGVSSRTEAAMYAVNHGLVSPSGQVGEAAAPPPLPLSPPLNRARWIGALLAFAVLLGLGLYGLFLVRRPPSSAGLRETALNRWETLPAMPTPRFALAAASYGDFLFAIGGYSPLGVSDAVERYHTLTKTWDSLAPKPTAVYEVAAAVIGGKVYVPGGRLASGQVSERLEVYDPLQNRWTQGAPLPAPRSAYALVAFEGHLFLFGGWDGDRVTATLFEYDPQEDRWLERAALPQACAYTGAAVVGRKVFLLGGFDGEKPLDQALFYLPDNERSGAGDPWQVAPRLPAPASAMGVASIADLIYVVGGVGAERLDYPVLIFQEQSAEWRTLEGAPPLAEDSLGLTVYGTKLALLGGRRGGQPLGEAYLYQALYTVSIPLIVR